MYDALGDGKTRMEVADRYRAVFFRSKNGKEVFAHMLGELGLFETTDGKTDRELGRFDYAIRLLNIMGVPSYPNIHQFVNASAKWATEYPKPQGETK